MAEINCSSMLAKYQAKLMNRDPSITSFDVIVISSRNELQTKSYELQLDSKFSDFESLRNKFIVISDPVVKNDVTNEVVKVGSGGSTIHIIQQLASKHSIDVLKKKKILLIHCGGYSQRTPQFSALGKIFSHLPINLQSKNCLPERSMKWTMLDVKLALLELFASKMTKGGLFLTAPDDIVIYDGIDLSDWNKLEHFDTESIIALGHPSPVPIALGHGVFVPESWPSTESGDDVPDASVQLLPVKRVLQKPSVEELNNNFALGFMSMRVDLAAITDSAYYIGSSILEKLYHFDLSTLACELDAYGHFLCPLGTDPLVTKGDTKNKFYSPIVEFLQGTRIECLFIPQSKFYHLGSIPEYLTEIRNIPEKSSNHSEPLQLSEHLSFVRDPDHGSAIVMDSLLSIDSDINSGTIIESSYFDCPIKATNCILHGIIITKEDIASAESLGSQTIIFPDDHLFFMVAVNVQENNSDAATTNAMKKCYITIGLPLNRNYKSYLWEEKLFKYFDTRMASLLFAIVNCDKNLLTNADYNLDLNTDKLSLRDILLITDQEEMISIKKKYLS